jgi:hypothetical protein
LERLWLEGVRFIPLTAKPSQRDLDLVFAWQGNGPSVANLEADFTAWQAAKWVSHDGPARLGVPLEDVVRAEVQALQICAAGVGVNRGEPREFLTKKVPHCHWLYSSSSHE